MSYAASDRASTEKRLTISALLRLLHASRPVKRSTFEQRLNLDTRLRTFCGYDVTLLIVIVPKPWVFALCDF